MWNVLGGKIRTGVWLGNLREETTLEYSSLDEKTKSQWTFKEIRQKDLAWPHLTQNRYKRQSFVSKITILGIPKKRRLY